MAMKICPKCDNQIDGNNNYCRFCYSHYKRMERISNPEAYKKDKARGKARIALKKSLIFKHDCSCGSTESEMHHPDYDKPLEVVWYCRKCHDAFHVLERKALCAS